MRMWNVNPKLLCRKHLLGEHFEMHKFAGCISKGKSIQGYIDTGLVETGNIEKRHDELVEEMLERGYNHNSPLSLSVEPNEGSIKAIVAYLDLMARCEECLTLSYTGGYKIEGNKS